MVGLLKWTSARPHPHLHPSSMSLSSSKIAIYMRKLREITRTLHILDAAYIYVDRISSANVSASMIVLHACVRVCECVFDCTLCVHAYARGYLNMCVCVYCVCILVNASRERARGREREKERFAHIG